MKRFLLLCLCLLPLYLSAHQVTGQYNVAGYDPILDEHYVGTAQITENDDVYTITWFYADTFPYVGTGVRKGDSISFVFHQLTTTDFGTQLYHIKKDKLSGPWIISGDTRIGHEVLTKFQD